MLLMHGLSYGPALTRNTKERASVYQSDKVGLRPHSCNLPYDSLLFLTFSVLVANPKKLFYTVANPARGLLNREKRKKNKSGSIPPPPPPILLVRRKIRLYLLLLTA